MKVKTALLTAVSLWPLVSVAQHDHTTGGAQEHSEQAQAAPSAQAGHGPMHEHMQTMREQMARIHAAEDPAERRRLMDEHMQSMGEHMRRMARDPDPGRDTATAQSGCAEGDMPCRMRELETRERMVGQRMGSMQERMTHMQQLMEQMMEHLREMQSPRDGAPERSGRRR